MPVIEVVVVDDHPPLRVGITQPLEQARGIRVVGEADDGHVLLSVSCRNPSTYVVLLEDGLPDFDVQDAIRQLKEQYPSLWSSS